MIGEAEKTIAPEVRDKLAKLVPRLASDQDGEVVATVAAIRRVLQSAALDLHDLAETIRRPPDVVTRYVTAGPSHAPARRRTRRAYPKAEGHKEFATTEEKLDFIGARENAPTGLISEKEWGFLNSVRGRVAAGWPLSEAQEKWLNDIVDRVWNEG